MSEPSDLQVLGTILFTILSSGVLIFVSFAVVRLLIDRVHADPRKLNELQQMHEEREKDPDRPRMPERLPGLHRDVGLDLEMRRIRDRLDMR